MAQVANLTTISLEGTDIGNITAFSAPNKGIKEFDATTLDDTMENFQPSTLAIAGECTLTVHLTTTMGVAVNDAGTWLITYPDTTTDTFYGFVRDASTVDGDASAEEALVQTFTIRVSVDPS